MSWNLHDQSQMFHDLPSLLWLGNRAQHYTGSLLELIGILPRFRRIPFRIGRLANPYADLIVRKPKRPNENPIPVAMVSKAYVLVDHWDLAHALAKGLETIDQAPMHLYGRLTLSEFGERMHLQLAVPTYTLPLGGAEMLSMQVHCLNSVDRSMSLQIRLGWYRDICRNGFFWGTEAAGVSHAHTGALWSMDIPQVIQEQLLKFDAELERIAQWQQVPSPSLKALSDWADSVLAKRWGVHAAARFHHIVSTGYDGDVEPTNQRTKPSAYVVHKTKRVPGIPAPVETLFDVSQALSWIASYDTLVHRQLERMMDIHGLMTALVERTGKSNGRA